MVAPVSPTQQDSDSESSEDLQRFREAAWEVALAPASGKEESSCRALQPSLRFKADEHEQDGNELQTTPEFRVHVAKKLGAMLDSYICISENCTGQGSVPKQATDSTEDGFRLFFSSAPGCSEDVVPPPLKKRRLPSSSSEQDSDEEWQRCQEAAVSGMDILKHSAIPVLQQDPRANAGQECGAENQTKKKKRKKKKKKKAEVEEASSAQDGQTMNRKQGHQECDRQDNGTGDAASLRRRRKKKKKKAEVEEASSAQDGQTMNRKQGHQECDRQENWTRDVVSLRRRKKKKKRNPAVPFSKEGLKGVASEGS